MPKASEGAVLVDLLIRRRGATVQEINNETDNTYRTYNSPREPTMAKKTGKKPENEGWTTVAISLAVRLFIDRKSLEYRQKHGVITRESVDTTLRRILGIKEDEK